MRKVPSADSDAHLLATLQRRAFAYFLHETNPENGLVADTTAPGAPSSIAAVGLALTALPVAVERGLMSRRDAVTRTLATLRFLHASPQGPDANATGHHGFYYHFLDMRTGARAWNCELSTVDSALLLAGVLVAAEYFVAGHNKECEIRALAELLYARVNWRWALNGGLTLTHGWTPERGFLPWRWEGYDEALLLYVLALGSRTHAISAESYTAWASTYEWRSIYGIPQLYAGPLFTHQLSHLWIDFRQITDEFMREHASDYFENSRRATIVHHEYAIRNPGGYRGYGDGGWGITASEGPGDVERVVDGVRRRFFGYVARGVPDGPDDGTISPWAVISSLPFAPELVIPAMAHMERHGLGKEHPYGFWRSYNPTFPGARRGASGWASRYHCGLNQGPIVAMIENFRTDLIWSLLRGSTPIARGLRAAGFAGGWLTATQSL